METLALSELGVPLAATQADLTPHQKRVLIAALEHRNEQQRYEQEAPAQAQDTGTRTDRDTREAVLARMRAR